MHEAGDLAGAIDLLEDLSELHARAGEHVRALEHLEANVSLRRELGDAAGLCRTLLAVGKSRLRQHPAQLQRAQRDLKSAISLAQELGSVSLLAQARGWLGHAHWLARRLDEADDLLNKSYRDLEQLGDVSRMAQVRLGQGRWRRRGPIRPWPSSWAARRWTSAAKAATAPPRCRCGCC